MLARVTTHPLRQPFEGDLDAVLDGASQEENVLLLDGATPWDGESRCALLFSPRWILRVAPDGRPRIHGDPPPRARLLAEDPLANLLDLLPRASAEANRSCFCGVAGYFGYESGTRRLGAPTPPRSRFEVDDVWLGAFDRALEFRRDERGRPVEAEIVVADHPIFGRVESAERRMAEAREWIRRCRDRRPPPSGGEVSERKFFDRSWHGHAVDRIHHYLRRGDSYQVNLTGFASARTDVAPYRAYRRETQRNPVSFSAHLRTAAATITCHSPELLLRLRGLAATTAPIKGTIEARPGAEQCLRASAKDRAEHVMIVDLCRNDLGRHARFGSVRVETLAAPMHLRGIVHLVSRIHAELDARGRAAVLGDLFPAGSITGAPKRRTLDIIAEVEEFRRGPYTGSFGYVNVHGDADWNIAIRTAVWQDGAVHFGCGGGIVLDSDATLEYAEARWKAQSFFDSLEAVSREAPGGPTLQEESMP